MDSKSALQRARSAGLSVKSVETNVVGDASRAPPNNGAALVRQIDEVTQEVARLKALALAFERWHQDMISLVAQNREMHGKGEDLASIVKQLIMLSLNAAIEAARAGEQGRGFAVVADEVRKLAERTTTATKEIAQMIATIQDGTTGAIKAMEIGSQQVQEGVTSTARAGESLKQIINMSEEVGSMITHIATAATQQSGATSDVNQSMDQIAHLGKESAAAAQQSAKACQDLSELALALQNMVGGFKLLAARDDAPHLEKLDHPKALAAAAH